MEAAARRHPDWKVVAYWPRLPAGQMQSKFQAEDLTAPLIREKDRSPGTWCHAMFLVLRRFPLNETEIEPSSSLI